jgi:diguanylate cyclase (GGDEF)-like protein
MLFDLEPNPHMDACGPDHGRTCAAPMSEIQKRIEKAEKWLQRGKPEAALEEFLAVLDSDPSHEIASHTAADIQVSLGRNSEACILLGALFDRQCDAGDNAKAAVTYRKLARITRPSGERSLKFARDLAKNPNDALKGYQSALQSFMAKGRKEDALAALNGIVALQPTIENLRKLGDVAADLGQNATASQAYLRAGRLETDEHAKFVFFEQAYKLQPDKWEQASAHAELVLGRGDGEKTTRILQPFVESGQADPAARLTFARALAKSGRHSEALSLLWEALERDASSTDEVVRSVGALIAGGHTDEAIVWLEKLQKREFSADRRREFVATVKNMADRYAQDLPFLEYSADVFNASNREGDYCETLQKLFDLYFASGNFARAAECLERAAEVDAYEPGHRPRLDMLRGKVGNKIFNAIAERLNVGVSAPAAQEESQTEGNVLQDLLAQAQIYLRYEMDEKAREKLRRAQQLFPGVEQSSRETRELFVSAGMLLDAPDEPVSAAPDKGPVAELASPSPAFNGEDDLGRLATITRTLYRQTSVKSVLLAAVNELGRYCDVSRCMAVLCTPGKPPSIAHEYCAPDLSQSDIRSIVKLVGLLQPLAVVHGTLEISTARKTKAILRPLRKPLSAMGIHSLMAMPLLDGEEHAGLLILAENSSREWTTRDTTALVTGSEQVMLALNNVRLRRLVKDLAVTESGSGLVKRSSYLDVLIAEVARSLEQKSPLSVMLMNFSNLGANARFGDSTLEKFMRHIAQLVCSHVRQQDVAFRYGPSTIAVVLGDTPGPNAVMAADKLRKVAAVVSFPGHDGSPQIAIGVAQGVMEPSFEPADVVTELVNRAERALQHSLSQGGDNTQYLPLPGAAT